MKDHAKTMDSTNYTAGILWRLVSQKMFTILSTLRSFKINRLLLREIALRKFPKLFFGRNEFKSYNHRLFKEYDFLWVSELLFSKYCQMLFKTALKACQIFLCPNEITISTISVEVTQFRLRRSFCQLLTRFVRFGWVFFFLILFLLNKVAVISNLSTT